MTQCTTAGAIAAVALLLSACGSGSASFEPPPDSEPPPPSGPPAISVEPAFSGLSFNQPLALLQPPGDGSRWFVVERPGTIHMFPDDDNAAMADVGLFADLTARVNATPGEAGLLGMAFHPAFADNGQVYLSYTRGSLESVVSQFVVDAVTGDLDPGSEEILLVVPQPETNHNGGNIVFGPDGFLYIGFGDGGGAGDPGENGQDTGNVLGTILRIDVDGNRPYEIPADNPFAGNTECFNGSSAGMLPCPEIFAYGFRNPWRFSFDRDTGELWAGDVGQGSWEEVDRVEAGMNYGWDEREGAHCFEPTSGCATDNVDPIAEYDHSLGSSVTGGYVYRGSDVPALVGFYVFADYGSGRIWGVPFDSSQGTEPEELADTELRIASFAESNSGELFVLHIAGGTIHRIAAN